MDTNKQKILIIGGGGREHAIGWKVKQSPRAGQIYFAPGNAGTVKIGINVAIKATEADKLLDFAKKEKIDLTLAIPDDPLAEGIVDLFQKEGLRIFGPTKAAAQLESSKAYAKNFMTHHGLPTAKYHVFNDFALAETYLKTQIYPLVVKASGLALGKGVFICQNYDDAIEALRGIMVDKAFGDSGNEVVIEEFLSGPEISIHAFSDGTHHSMFPPAQDHKRAGDDDQGPNTGGMGTIAPITFLSLEQMKKIEDSIVAPTIAGMAKENQPFVGVLYPGLIVTAGGPKILEFNARFGDPETETYMRLLQTDLLDIVDACIDGKLEDLQIRWRNISACTIVLASGGYPGDYEKGKVISGVDEAEQNPDVIVFHAGTATRDGALVTNGGRVLGVSAIGSDLQEALDTAYRAVGKISFEGMQYRKDIGRKALELMK
ncbi:MAG TPA: phosphoribosylamine--glycine ligase [Candidatus Paceibacterota bacterium]|nr:phosphoribosylamine--glycine ligase [Candidatus Paceibacterota bacterium]